MYEYGLKIANGILLTGRDIGAGGVSGRNPKLNFAYYPESGGGLSRNCQNRKSEAFKILCIFKNQTSLSKARRWARNPSIFIKIQHKW